MPKNECCSNKITTHRSLYTIHRFFEKPKTHEVWVEPRIISSQRLSSKHTEKSSKKMFISD